MQHGAQRHTCTACIAAHIYTELAAGGMCTCQEATPEEEADHGEPALDDGFETPELPSEVVIPPRKVTKAHRRLLKQASKDQKLLGHKYG